MEPRELSQSAEMPEGTQGVKAGARTVIRILARPGFQAHEATVRDVSRNSIGLVLRHPLEAGTVLVLPLHRVDARVSGLLSAQVRQVTGLADSSWLLSCNFSRDLTDTELRDLL